MAMLSLVLSKFSCHVLVMSCYFCKMYWLMSIVVCMLFVSCYVCVLNFNGLIFTQVNKALARSLGVCLGEDVMVLAGYMLAGFTFLLNYITRLLWRPHKLLLSNYNPYLGSCKWQPPRSPFALALVTDWYQYSRCRAMHACGATL